LLVNYHKYNQNKYYYYKEMMVLVLYDAIIVLLNIHLHVFFLTKTLYFFQQQPLQIQALKNNLSLFAILFAFLLEWLFHIEAIQKYHNQLLQVLQEQLHK